MRCWTGILVALTIACAKKPPPSIFDRIDRLDFTDTPRLPASGLAIYGANPTTSPDVMTEALLQGWNYDGALAAAASALIMPITTESGGLTRWELHEAAWQGGWPYPVDEARSWYVTEGAPPPHDMLAWVDKIPKDEPMALVRARGKSDDIWIGLRAKPAIDLGSFPRYTSLGTPLTLPAIASAEALVADPVGTLQSLPLDTSRTLLLQRTGEWLIRIREGDKAVATFPIYVGLPPPDVPLLRDGLSTEVLTSADVDTRTTQLLEHIRKTYRLTPFRRSPMLDAAARAYVQDPARGSRSVLNVMGLPEARAIAWACDNTTVENCLDTWLWDPRRREVWMSSEIDSYGLVAELDTTGVHLTLLLVDLDSPAGP